MPKKQLKKIIKTGLVMGAGTVVLGSAANVAAGTGTAAGAAGATGLSNVASAFPAVGTIVGSGATIGIVTKMAPKKKRRKTRRKK